MSAGAIYFVQVGDDGAVKVGFSSNPGNRLAQLQGSHFERLHLIGLSEGSMWDEQKLHEKLAPFALGHEWYAAVPEVFGEIEVSVVRVAVALDKAVVAREHLQRAIALLRASDGISAQEELREVAELIAAALESEVAW